jgi:ABC-type multidrug transport system ATPase subunit
MTPDERDAVSDAVPVVEIDGVSHSFGDVPVLDDVSVSLRASSATALVGTNGSGKTTLLRIVAGLLSPETGTVRLATSGPRPVGYLPQSPTFRPVFTAGETLSFYADLLPVEVDVREALDTVGLAGVADRRVDALSGGMRRLLGIAQATLGEPDVVLLDEPTGDLDPQMTQRVFETIDRLADDGITVLLATHNLADATATDRVLMLDRGSVLASGSPEELIVESDGETLTEAFVQFAAEGQDEATVRSGVDVGGPADLRGIEGDAQ